MPHVNIFISYRRDDAAGHAGRLCDRLEEHFPGCVFMDVTGIAPGADFVRALEQKLASCQVLVVVIGKSWLSITEARVGRDEPDHARIEVASALRKGVPVFPVLVQGARMPTPAQLPPDLKALGNRNALEITEPDFRSDVRRLVEAIERLFSPPPRHTRQEPEFVRPPERSGLPLWLKLGLGLGATAVIGFFVIIAALLPFPNTNQDTNGNVSPDKFNSTSFHPPGTWLVTINTQNGPVSGTYRFHPNNQVEFAVGQSQGGGSWQYDEEESELTILGMNTFGVSFTEAFQIGDGRGDVYQVRHSALGSGTMRRLQ